MTTTASTRLQRITHEYPGVTILALDHFDIGIDPDVDGVNVCVYIGRWGDEHVSAYGFVIPSDDLLESERARDDEHHRRIGSPWIERVARADEERVHVVLTNGAALLVEGRHVFGYTEDDGNACCAIVHLGTVDPAECESLGCDTWQEVFGGRITQA